MTTSNGQEIRGTLTVERQEEILLVRLSRPEKRNAMNDGMVLELEHESTRIITACYSLKSCIP